MNHERLFSYVIHEAGEIVVPESGSIGDRQASRRASLQQGLQTGIRQISPHGLIVNSGKSPGGVDAAQGLEEAVLIVPVGEKIILGSVALIRCHYFADGCLVQVLHVAGNEEQVFSGKFFMNAQHPFQGSMGVGKKKAIGHQLMRLQHPGIVIPLSCIDRIYHWKRSQLIPHPYRPGAMPGIQQPFIVPHSATFSAAQYDA